MLFAFGGEYSRESHLRVEEGGEGEKFSLKCIKLRSLRCSDENVQTAFGYMGLGYSTGVGGTMTKDGDGNHGHWFGLPGKYIEEVGSGARYNPRCPGQTQRQFKGKQDSNCRHRKWMWQVWWSRINWFKKEMVKLLDNAIK